MQRAGQTGGCTAPMSALNLDWHTGLKHKPIQTDHRPNGGNTAIA